MNLNQEKIMGCALELCFNFSISECRPVAAGLGARLTEHANRKPEVLKPVKI